MNSFAPNPWLTLLTGVLYAISVLFLYKESNANKNTKIVRIAPIILLVLCVFAFYNDYWNYEEQLFNISRSNGLTTYGWEPVYLWIASFVGYDYFLWRLFVWGIGVIFVVLLFKKLEINKPYYWYVFIACYYWLFGYARSAVTLMLFVFGLVLFSEGKKMGNSLVGLTIMVFSIFGHKSLAVSFLVVPLFFLKPNKLFLLLSMAFAPVAIKITQYIMEYLPYFSLAVGDFEYYDIESFQNNFERMSEYDRFEDLGFMRILLERIIDICHYFLFLISIYYIILRNGYKQCSQQGIRLFMLMFVLAYIGICFAFCGLESSVFSYRIINMAVLPAVILAILLAKEGIVPKSLLSKMVLFTIGAEVMENIIYQMYVNLSNL